MHHSASLKCCNDCTAVGLVLAFGVVSMDNVWNVHFPRYRLKTNKAHDEIYDLELWGNTCHMGSHSVTCHLIQVNTPRLNPGQNAGTGFTYRGGMEC